MDIDVAQHIGAVTRSVTNGDRDGQPTRRVTATRAFATTVEDVWDAITSPERIPRWFLPITGDLRPGGRYQLEGNAGGEISECEPPRRFAVTWEFGGGVSWLEVRLADEDGRARLELVHTVPVDGHWEQFGPGAVGVGWDMGLMGLAEHLATGRTSDPAQGMAWMVSEQGRAFVQGSSEAWGSASVASGADAEWARAAEERTTAAYTGG